MSKEGLGFRSRPLRFGWRRLRWLGFDGDGKMAGLH